jgi:hypothetical protein
MRELASFSQRIYLLDRPASDSHRSQPLSGEQLFASLSVNQLMHWELTNSPRGENPGSERKRPAALEFRCTALVDRNESLVCGLLRK